MFPVLTQGSRLLAVTQHVLAACNMKLFGCCWWHLECRGPLGHLKLAGNRHQHSTYPAVAAAGDGGTGRSRARRRTTLTAAQLGDHVDAAKVRQALARNWEAVVGAAYLQCHSCQGSLLQAADTLLGSGH